MKSKIRHDVKKFVMKSKGSLWRQKHVMTSNSSSCFKNLKSSHSKTSWRQQVRHDINKFVMASKTWSWWQKVRNYLKKVRHNVKKTSQCQNVYHKIKNTSKVCHEVKTRHDVKKFVMTSKTCNDVKKFVITSTSCFHYFNHKIIKQNISKQQKLVMSSEIRHDNIKFVMTSKKSWRQKFVIT